MPGFTRFLSATLAILTLSANTQAESNVWIVADTTRVLRDAAPADQSFRHTRGREK